MAGGTNRWIASVALVFLFFLGAVPSFVFGICVGAGLVLAGQVLYGKVTEERLQKRPTPPGDGTIEDAAFPTNTPLGEGIETQKDGWIIVAFDWNPNLKFTLDFPSDGRECLVRGGIMRMREPRMLTKDVIVDIDLKGTTVSLVPDNLSKGSMWATKSPILLECKDRALLANRHRIFIFAYTRRDKEQWFYALRDGALYWHLPTRTLLARHQAEFQRYMAHLQTTVRHRLKHRAEAHDEHPASQPGEGGQGADQHGTPAEEQREKKSAASPAPPSPQTTANQSQAHGGRWGFTASTWGQRRTSGSAPTPTPGTPQPSVASLTPSGPASPQPQQTTRSWWAPFRSQNSIPTAVAASESPSNGLTRSTSASALPTQPPDRSPRVPTSLTPQPPSSPPGSPSSSLHLEATQQAIPSLPQQSPEQPANSGRLRDSLRGLWRRGLDYSNQGADQPGTPTSLPLSPPASRPPAPPPARPPAYRASLEAVPSGSPPLSPHPNGTAGSPGPDMHVSPGPISGDGPGAPPPRPPTGPRRQPTVSIPSTDPPGQQTQPTQPATGGESAGVAPPRPPAPPTRGPAAPQQDNAVPVPVSPTSPDQPPAHNHTEPGRVAPLAKPQSADGSLGGSVGAVGSTQGLGSMSHSQLPGPASLAPAPEVASPRPASQPLQPPSSGSLAASQPSSTKGHLAKHDGATKKTGEKVGGDGEAGAIKEHERKRNRGLRNSRQLSDLRALAFFNMMWGRMFWDMHLDQHRVERWRKKLEVSLEKARRPSFISRIAVKDFRLGSNPPIIESIDRVACFQEGIVCECKLYYEGGMSMAVECDVGYDHAAAATANTTTADPTCPAAGAASGKEGGRLKSRLINTVANMVAGTGGTAPVTIRLAVQLRHIYGDLILQVTPPPTDRVWLSFREPPELEVEVQPPQVGLKAFSMVALIDFIKSKLKEVFMERWVLPGMADMHMSLLEASTRPPPSPHDDHTGPTPDTAPDRPTNPPAPPRPATMPLQASPGPGRGSGMGPVSPVSSMGSNMGGVGGDQPRPRPLGSSDSLTAAI